MSLLWLILIPTIGAVLAWASTSGPGCDRPAAAQNGRFRWCPAGIALGAVVTIAMVSA